MDWILILLSICIYFTTINFQAATATDNVSFPSYHGMTRHKRMDFSYAMSSDYYDDGSRVDEPRLATITGAATSGQFPYIVGVLTGTTSANALIICQGALITTTMVVTSGSCTFDVATNTLYAASALFLLSGTIDSTASTTRTAVTTVIRHPRFQYYPVSKVFTYDIALLVTTTTISGGSVISLTKKRSKAAYIKKTGTVVGWGGLTAAATAPVDDLNYISTLTFIKYSVCKTSYKAFAPNITFPTHYICTSTTGGTVGYCVYDQGDPLVYTDSKSTVRLIGIASQQQTGSCPPVLPNYYAFIPKFKKWIKKNGGPSS